VVLLLFPIDSLADGRTPVRISAFGQQPQIALGPGGETYVVFGEGNSIFIQVSRAPGKPFSEPKKIAELDHLALGKRRGPRLAVTNNYVIVSAIGKAGNLQAWRSKDGGISWAGPVNVNDREATAREGLHTVCAVKGDGVFAAWLDLRHGKTELAEARSPDGGKTWSENSMIYQSPDGHICECCHPSAVADGTGRIYVMWRNWLNGARDMYAAVSRDGGATFGPAVKLGTGSWPLKACPMDGGSLAASAKQGIGTVWRREGNLFYMPGLSAGEKFLGEGSQPVVAYSRDAAYMLWQSNGSIFLLAPGNGEPSNMGKGAFPSIVGSPYRPKPVAVWEDGQGIVLLGW
jgi:hypothetical protein